MMKNYCWNVTHTKTTWTHLFNLMTYIICETFQWLVELWLWAIGETIIAKLLQTETNANFPISRSDVELLTREQFEDKKCELLDTSTTTWRPYMLFSYNCRSIDLMLIELAERERPNRLGMISVDD